MTGDETKATISDAMELSAQFILTATGHSSISKYIAALVYYKFIKGQLQNAIGSNEADVYFSDLEQIVEDVLGALDK